MTMIQRMDRCYKLSMFLLQRQQQQRRLLRSAVKGNRLFVSQQIEDIGREEEEETDCTTASSSISISSTSTSRRRNDIASHQLNPINTKLGISSKFHNHHLNQYNYHCYHTTTKKEILPLIAVGSLAVLGTYGYRALKRMDDEWDEYQEALKEYKLEHGLSDDDDHDDMTSSATLFKQGTMSVDLGSTNVRIAHLSNTSGNNGNNSTGNNKPKVIVNRQGGRSTPNSIIVDTDGSIISGQLAAAKIYERSQSNNPVLNPYTLLMNQQKQKQEKMTINYAIENVISPLAANALEQAVGGSNSTSHSSSKIIFSADALTDVGGYNTQPIFTYPPPDSNNDSNSDDGSDSLYVQLYQDAVKDIISPSSIAKFIPEPICAVKGAKFFNVLPSVSSSPSQSSSIMVIDIGGSTSSISIVDGERYTIQYHSRVHNFGGETIIESLMNYLCKSFYNVPTVKSVPDTMGVQRLYDASKDALKEMMGSGKSRAQINIPYLSVDEKMQPKHLDLGVSVKVLEAEFNDYVKDSVVPDVIVPQNLLSSSMSSSSPSGQPSDLETLFSSMIMNVFEKSGQNPFTLNSVLVVGGGARSPMFQNSLKASFGKLAGEQFVQERVIFPKGALVEEMVVLGAALSSND